MNDLHDSLPEPDDDPTLDEAISLLKRLEPPLETRIANRMAVAAELSSLSGLNRQRHLPWWRRSVSIPVPFAASLVVLAAFSLQLGVRSWHKQLAKRVTAPVQLTEGPSPSRSYKTEIVRPVRDVHSVLKYYETETYLCGIGRVNSESFYSIKEQDRE
jgi:hypothetical protein